jgi:hypothetical protein
MDCYGDISPETTWITEPIGTDGYVDYVRHLQHERDRRPCGHLSGELSLADKAYTTLNIKLSGVNSVSSSASFCENAAFR